MVEDTAAYREMMRMSHDDFKVLLRVVEPHISPHQVQGGQKVIPAPARLTLTIRFLAIHVRPIDPCAFNFVYRWLRYRMLSKRFVKPL